jgi:two-component system response regulator AlgR
MSLRVMVVDDEALARQRLRTLLGDCRQPSAHWVGEAAHAPQAVALLAHTPVDVVLLDIHMPGVDGLALARTLSAMAHPPALVFVTAHAEHAVHAFELDAVDYLTKPVRLERLEQALAKASRRLETRADTDVPPQVADDHVLITERGRTERVALADVVYFKAELKYITVRTREREYVLDGSLSDLEQRHAVRVVRVHRNALVTRTAIQGLERSTDPAEPDVWWLKLYGVPERLVVSRRQLPLVRDAMSGQR